MLHAVIIDDEINGVRSLELLIQKFVPEIKVVSSTTNSVEGIDIINNFRPDIVFLDINMPVLNGFQLLDNLEYKKFNLIFTTAHGEYGLKALKQNATDYLLKPVDIEELKTAVERVKKKINKQHSFTEMNLLIQDSRGLEKIKVSLPGKLHIEYVSPTKIIYIEAHSSTCKVLLIGESSFEATKPLKDFENTLCKSGSYFMRIHNSFIINLHHVVRYLREDGGYVVMTGKKTIPISKNKKDSFLKAINLKID